MRLINGVISIIINKCLYEMFICNSRIKTFRITNKNDQKVCIFFCMKLIYSGIQIYVRGSKVAVSVGQFGSK